MLGEVDVIGAYGVQRSGQHHGVDQADPHRAAVAGDRSKRAPQRDASTYTGSASGRGEGAQIQDAGDGRRRHQHRPLQHEPLLSHVSDDPFEGDAAGHGHRHRLPDPGHQTVGELHEGPLAAGAVGDLVGQVSSAVSVELSLQIIEEGVPSHRTILAQVMGSLVHKRLSPLDDTNSKVSRCQHQQMEANKGKIMTLTLLTNPPPSSAAAITAGVLGAVTAGFGHLTLALAEPWRHQAASDPATVVVVLAAGAGTLVATRLTLCAAATTLALLAHSRGRPAGVATWIALRAGPRAVRPALSALLVTTVVLGAAAPALAQAAVRTTAISAQPALSAVPATVATPATPLASAHGPGLPPVGWPALPRPGWVATPPRAGPRIEPGAGLGLVATTGPRERIVGDEVVVRRGDTLWHLAARSLGPGAHAAEIAAEWPRWWQTNRLVIGADPDLLLPGTRLSVPSPRTHPTAIREESR